jgi:exopolysaccharide biosynthesis polyprenyl glycosylphosphotransferase
VQQDLSAEQKSVLEPTILLPEIRPGTVPARLDPGADFEPPDGFGWANHPPANQGPRPHRPSPRKTVRNARIPSPATGAGAPASGAHSPSPVIEAGPPAERADSPSPVIEAGPPASRAGGPATGSAGAKPDNALSVAVRGKPDRARNDAVNRHWSERRNRSSAVRLVSRPFVRVRGRHAAMSRRQRWERRYVRALVLSDLLAGTAAGAVTFGLRFGDQVTLYNRGYVILSAVLPVALLLVLAVSRAYERRFLFVGTDEYQRVFRGGVGLIAGAALISYALDLDLARSYVLAALPTSIGAVVVLRFALRKRLHVARARGESLRRVILAGHELSIIGMTRQLRRERYHGLEVVGACLPPGHDGVGLGGPQGLTVYGTFDDVASAVERADADTVVVLSCPELDGAALRRLAWRLERDEVDLVVASALVDVAGARTTIRPFDGLPMLHVEHPRLHGGSRLVKDLFDRVGALALLLAFGPLLVAVALCVRLTSRGPVLFRQVRVGRDGRQFRIFKFRSMYVDAEARLAELRHLNEHDGVLFKIRDDPRVTRVGRWLRRLSLDELPQLLNVLFGQMSLVGPRPPLPSEVAAYADDVRRRLAVKPGMTGLWQVSGRSDLSWEEAVRLDLRYVENWSLSLDLVILLRTMTAVVRSSGAY